VAYVETKCVLKVKLLSVPKKDPRKYQRQSFSPHVEFNPECFGSVTSLTPCALFFTVPVLHGPLRGDLFRLVRVVPLPAFPYPLLTNRLGSRLPGASLQLSFETVLKMA
jgi:hypothetical protein